MATGNSYKSLHCGFRVVHITISKIIHQTCGAIFEEYGSEVTVTPTNPEEMMEVAEKCSKRWDFHNVVGALDGKYVAIRCPPKSGSFYFNYKGFYSIILLALVDAGYNCLYVDIGANGTSSDGGVFDDTSLYDALEEGTAGLPETLPIPNDDQHLPFCIVGDDAFGLRTWLLKPYPHRCMTNQEKIFNYRLSRAR